jgi:hypothetical protein
MSDCSVQKIAGVIFTKGIQGNSFWHSKRGSISTLESTLKELVLIL